MTAPMPVPSRTPMAIRNTRELPGHLVVKQQLVVFAPAEQRIGDDDRFSRLPNELLLDVMKRVDEIDLASLSTVSIGLRTLACDETLWEPLCTALLGARDVHQQATLAPKEAYGRETAKWNRRVADNHRALANAPEGYRTRDVIVQKVLAQAPRLATSVIPPLLLIERPELALQILRSTAAASGNLSMSAVLGEMPLALRLNKAFLLEALPICGAVDFDSYALPRQVPDEMKADRDVALSLVKSVGNGFASLPQALRDDDEIARAAFMRAGSTYKRPMRDLGPTLRQDEAFVASVAHRVAVNDLPVCFQSNPKVLLRAVAGDPTQLMKVDAAMFRDWRFVRDLKAQTTDPQQLKSIEARVRTVKPLIARLFGE